MSERKKLLVLVALLILCVILLVATLRANREVISDYLKASGIDVEEFIPEPFRSPTPGPSPTPDPNIYAVTPWPRWSESKKEELDQRAQTLYDCPKCYVDFEIENPVFKRVFPQARMYAVRHDIHFAVGSSSVDYKMMVSQGGRDYRMPEQFNQLMFDAGYELNDETRDDLAQALVIAALFPETVARPITCETGEEIDEPISEYTTYRYGYKIHCHSGNYDIVVKFRDFSDQLRGGEVKIGEVVYGFRLDRGDEQ